MLQQVIDALVDFLWLVVGYAAGKRVIEALEKSPASVVFRPDIPEIGSLTPVAAYALWDKPIERALGKIPLVKPRLFLLGAMAWGGGRLLKNLEARFKFKLPITAFEQPS